MMSDGSCPRCGQKRWLGTTARLGVSMARLGLSIVTIQQCSGCGYRTVDMRDEMYENDEDESVDQE